MKEGRGEGEGGGRGREREGERRRGGDGKRCSERSKREGVSIEQLGCGDITITLPTHKRLH